MLDHWAPACRGVASTLFPVLLLALASSSLDAGRTAAAESSLAAGATAPPLALASLDDGPQDLAALRQRPALIHFFATWCVPCREEMAGLGRLAARLADTPLAILAVDVGEPPVRLRRFLAGEPGGPPPFPILIDEARAALKAWQVAVLPTSYLLAADRTLRLAAAGPVDWDDARAMAALDSLLAGRPLPATFTLPALPDTSGSPQP